VTRDIRFCLGRIAGRGLLALGLLGASLLPAAPASAAQMTIRLCGFENRVGTLRIAVFSRAHAKDFTVADSEAYSLGITLSLADAEPGPVVRVTTPFLVPGDYAVRVIHDENANGVFDRSGIVGMPVEAYGYSRNARARVSAVEFDEAMITLGSEPVDVDIRIVRWSLTGGDTSPCLP
jgi:uncharacterized protein (DUF2141 family)